MNNTAKSVYMIAFGLVFLIEFGTISLLSFKLGLLEYNSYQKIINILPFAMAIISLGAPFSIVYFISSGYQNKKYLFDANLASGYAFLAALILAAAFAFLSQSYIYLMLAVALGFFGAVKQNTISYYLGKKDLIQASKIRIYQKSFALLPVVFVVLLGFHIGIGQLFALLLFGEIIGFIVLQHKYKIMSAQTKVKYLKRFRVTSYYSFLTNSVSMFMAAAPFLILGYFSDDPKVEIEFAIAIMIIRYTTLMLGPFMQLIVPSVAAIKKERARVSQWIRKNIPIVLVVAFGLFVLMYLLGGFAVGLLFSDKYKNATAIVEILSLLLPFLILNSFLAATLSALGKIELVFKITLVTSLILVAASSVTIFVTEDVRMFSFSIILSYMVGTFLYIQGYRKW